MASRLDGTEPTVMVGIKITDSPKISPIFCYVMGRSSIREVGEEKALTDSVLLFLIGQLQAERHLNCRIGFCLALCTGDGGNSDLIDF